MNNTLFKIVSKTLSVVAMVGVLSCGNTTKCTEGEKRDCQTSLEGVCSEGTQNCQNSE